MQGQVVVCNKEGWYCSNDSYIDIESDVVRDPITGKPISSIKTKVVIASGLYTVCGNLKDGDDVECLFEIEEGKMLTFVGTVRSVAGRKVNIVIQGEFKDGKEVVELANKIDNTFN